MNHRHSIAVLLVITLIAGLFPSVALAADGGNRHKLDDAVAFRISTRAILAAADQRPGAAWKSLDSTMREIIEDQLAEAKLERERLRQDRDRVLGQYGPDEVCERRAIEQAYGHVDAQLAAYVKGLRHVRGNHEKAMKKLGRFLKRNVLEPLAKAAKRAIKEAIPELAIIYLTQGSLSGVAAKSVGRKAFARALRQEGKDLAVRAIARKVVGTDPTSVEDMLAEICDETQAGAGEAGAGAGDGSTTTPTPVSVTCDDGGSIAPLPPYAEDALLVTIEWPSHHDTAIFRYVVTDKPATSEVEGEDPAALSDPFGGTWGAYTGGCSDEAIICGARPPIVLTDDISISGANVVWGEHDGSFAVTAMSSGLCALRDGEGGAYLATDPGQVTVTAKLTYYRAGEASACHEAVLGSEQVPAVDEFVTDIHTTHRLLGAFEWDGSVDAVCGAADDDGAPPWGDDP